MKQLLSCVAFGICGALCVSAIGCGSGETFGSTEGEEVALTISALADVAQSEQAFADFFAPDAVPENRVDYAARAYDVTEAASISGDTATLKITVSGGSMGSADAEGRGNAKAQEAPEVTSGPQVVEWKLKKIGDEWKLTDAPLP